VWPDIRLKDFWPDTSDIFPPPSGTSDTKAPRRKLTGTPARRMMRNGGFGKRRPNGSDICKAFWGLKFSLCVPLRYAYQLACWNAPTARPQLYRAQRASLYHAASGCAGKTAFPRRLRDREQLHVFGLRLRCFNSKRPDKFNPVMFRLNRVSFENCLYCDKG